MAALPTRLCRCPRLTRPRASPPPRPVGRRVVAVRIAPLRWGCLFLPCHRCPPERRPRVRAPPRNNTGSCGSATPSIRRRHPISRRRCTPPPSSLTSMRRTPSSHMMRQKRHTDLKTTSTVLCTMRFFPSS